MNDAPLRPVIVRTFMTHDMKDEDIAGLSTGREEEFRRIMDAIKRSREASPGPLQHVVLYGSRGFGKSFLTRRVQIAVAQMDSAIGPVVYVLLPEEQHNLQRSPHAFLDAIALKLSEVKNHGDASYETALFQWPKAGEEAKRWSDAAMRLEEGINKALPKGKGLIIAVVENFDALLATLFKAQKDEQRLRLWLDRQKNRVMLFATATGTVDLDYDRPLFKAFEPVRLSPWTAEDCVAYFNRLREHEGRARLSNEEEAKARAISEFIGGTPRLAQLLVEVLDTQDALTVAEIMSALADRLAEYYRRRIEDLPPLARGLLDALIRGGEPASQTEIAARVKARGQSDIARTMSELQRADIVRGRPARDSRETLYSVTDRVFVHYYRLRQGSRAAQTTPLATILDFLRSFYSRDEQRAQAFRYLEAGHLAEADLFSRLAQDGVPNSENVYTRHFAKRLRRYLDAVPDVLSIDAVDIVTMLRGDVTKAYDFCRKQDCTTPVAAAIVSSIKAQALYQLGHTDKARKLLEETSTAVVSDATASVIIGEELLIFLSRVLTDWRAASNVGQRMQAVSPDGLSPRLALTRTNLIYWSLRRLRQFNQALEYANHKAELSRQLGNVASEMSALTEKAFILGQLDRDDEALAAARHAVAVARQAGRKDLEARALSAMVFPLSFLDNYDEALDASRRAIELAQQIDSKDIEADAFDGMVIPLEGLGRDDEALEAARCAIKLARQVGRKSREVHALTQMASCLRKLGRHEEAGTAVMELSAIARETGDPIPLSLFASQAISNSMYTPNPAALTLYREWVEIWTAAGESSGMIQPALYLPEAFLAAAITHDFSELDVLLATHGEELAKSRAFFYFTREGGDVLAAIALKLGRAATFEVVAGLLSRIAVFMARLPEEKRDPTWLPDLISGFARNCRDPAVLRDVATLLTGELAPQALGSATLLQALADFDEARDAETALARMDPDIATFIRLLRNIPNPPPIQLTRTTARQRKRPT